MVTLVGPPAGTVVGEVDGLETSQGAPVRPATKIVGEEKAKAYQLVLEYFPSPPVDCGNFEDADGRVVTEEALISLVRSEQSPLVVAGRLTSA